MPLYKFECEDCRDEFEELVSISSKTPPCPHCGSEKVVKKISLVASTSGTPNYPSLGSTKAPSCSSGST